MKLPPRTPASATSIFHASPDAPNVDGATPLMVAAGLGCKAAGEEAGSEAECLAVVDFLLANGAEINRVEAV